MALQESSSRWNSLSDNMRAHIPQQPAMLQGGQLREYQLEVGRLPSCAAHTLAATTIPVWSPLELDIEQRLFARDGRGCAGWWLCMILG